MKTDVLLLRTTSAPNANGCYVAGNAPPVLLCWPVFVVPSSLARTDVQLQLVSSAAPLLRARRVAWRHRPRVASLAVFCPFGGEAAGIS